MFFWPENTLCQVLHLTPHLVHHLLKPGPPVHPIHHYHSLVDELGLILPDDPPDVESAMLENVQDPEKTSELLSQKEISSMTMSLLGSMSRLVICK